MVEIGATVLDGLAADMASVSGASVSLTALPILGQIAFRAGADCLPLAAAALGVSLPAEANRFQSDGARAALWLGPDEWLLLVPRPEVATTIARFEMALAGHHFAAVDTSAARLGLALSGPMARTVMAKSCHLDLHPHRFGPGHVAQTTLARVPAVILQRDELPSYWVLVRPSYAMFVTRWLIDAMREFQLPPIPS